MLEILKDNLDFLSRDYFAEMGDSWREGGVRCVTPFEVVSFRAGEKFLSHLV